MSSIMSISLRAEKKPCEKSGTRGKADVHWSSQLLVVLYIEMKFRRSTCGNDCTCILNDCCDK